MAYLTALENRAAALAGPDVLRSPWAPSAEDVKSLEQMHFDLEECLPQLGVDVRQTDARVRALERALRLSRHRLESLRAQQVRVARQAKVCKATAKAFIRRPPIEIMVMIFSLVLEPGTSFYGRELHSITATCSWWRSVALSAPSLWSTICLAWSSLHFDVRYPRAPNAALVRAQLKHSANAPLDVTVTMYNLRAGECAHAAYDGSWAAVREQSHRWRTADISWYCNSGWRNASVLALPMLERLTITDPHGKAIPCFADAPNLRTAIVEGFNQATCPQPWKLTTLTLDNVSPADAIPVLQQLSQTLQSLHIRPLYRDYTTASRSTSISFPELSILGFGSLKQCQAFCPLLTVPMLEKLSLEMSDFTAVTCNAAEHIVEMVRRSSASVMDLTICHLHAASSQCLLRLLKGLPTLEFLHLYADSGHELLDDQFFCALTPTTENLDCPLPNLVELAVTASIVYDPAGVDFATLHQMFNALRREDVVINGQLYPALEERSLTRNPNDDLFVAYDSDDDDEEYVPNPTDTDDETDYSMSISDDEDESQSDLEIFGAR
ncbi:uncharacterized protein SCHCODRAFT_02546527 [Schizophyllum commune H4-8]|nr:uncharacterized protein SCHCODRAFT_02546527 [Schizophyllum commune H4-8]KAI5890209.1 hypothetical protein SCHCODRAFT_02546527 [Schizophyllum commune H4-8]